jgi:hypothetical protein
MSGNGTALDSRKLTLSLLPPAESPAAAEEVAAAAEPVAVADAEEDMFFGGSRRVVTSGLHCKQVDTALMFGRRHCGNYAKTIKLRNICKILNIACYACLVLCSVLI